VEGQTARTSGGMACDEATRLQGRLDHLRSLDCPRDHSRSRSTAKAICTAGTDSEVEGHASVLPIIFSCWAPGAGTSRLARRLTTILPAMTLAAAIDPDRLPRVAGLTVGRTAVVITRLLRDGGSASRPYSRDGPLPRPSWGRGSRRAVAWRPLYGLLQASATGYGWSPERGVTAGARRSACPPVHSGPWPRHSGRCAGEGWHDGY
jgi:hypothetical protein